MTGKIILLNKLWNFLRYIQKFEIRNTVNCETCKRFHGINQTIKTEILFYEIESVFIWIFILMTIFVGLRSQCM